MNLKINVTVRADRAYVADRPVIVDGVPFDTGGADEDAIVRAVCAHLNLDADNPAVIAAITISRE